MESHKVALEAKEETIRAKQEVTDALRGEKHLKHNCYIYNPTHDHRAIN